MENIVFTQLSIPEVRKILREELVAYFECQGIAPKQPETSVTELLTIDQAAQLLNLSKATLYGYVHDQAIPYSKIRKRLYFSRKELNAWIQTARRKTISEINASAEESLIRKWRK